MNQEDCTCGLLYILGKKRLYLLYDN